jgi:catechol 2,3-dioxygenase-like lactoylglutathione lyase family enzyme
VTSRHAAAQRLRDLVRLRRVRDRIDREYALPLDVEALARGAHMSAWHLSRDRPGRCCGVAILASPRSVSRSAARRWAPSASHHRAGRGVAEHLPATRGMGDRGYAAETGDQTDQESRSPGHRAATSVTAMDLTIHTTFLPHDDPDASLAFWRDTLGLEVRNDVGKGRMRWITVGPADQPGTSILLGPPDADPGITDDERRTITEMMAKGTYGWISLATADLDGTFERLQASDAEVVQEPTEQPYGVRDCAFRDPAGNLIRIQELR